MSNEELRRRLGLTPGYDVQTTEDFLYSLTPQQRNALCELRTRARMEPKFSAFPLIRVQDVPAWAATLWEAAA